MIKTADLRGLICPEPVLRTKRLFDDMSVHRVEALVDDEVCVNNLKRLSHSLDASATVHERDGYFEVVMERAEHRHPHVETTMGSALQGEGDRGAARAGTREDLAGDLSAQPIEKQRPGESKEPSAGQRVEAARSDEASKAPGRIGTVIFLAKDTFGDGDPAFSRTLINLFLQSVLQSGLVPRAILLANSGVKLMAPDSQTQVVLQDFQAKGCEVLACGLCLEFYGLKDRIARDQITNMYSIVEYLFAADKVLTP